MHLSKWYGGGGCSYVPGTAGVATKLRVPLHDEPVLVVVDPGAPVCAGRHVQHALVPQLTHVHLENTGEVVSNLVYTCEAHRNLINQLTTLLITFNKGKVNSCTLDNVYPVYLGEVLSIRLIYEIFDHILNI
jgi:hypothetical protein